MNKAKLLFGLLLLQYGLSQQPIKAQIVPDSTLGDSSSIVTGETDFLIEGGIQQGSNLFHSFETFSIPEGFTALFDNGSSVERALVRVTGSDVSIIDGLIETNDVSDLFILNPNGIDFLPSASVNIGGSFLATTADGVRFEDGYTFAINSLPDGVLTSSVPVGLNLSSENSISLSNLGHTLTGDLVTPLSEVVPSRGLSIDSGKTIVLVGGSILSDGGIVEAAEGHIELAAVQEGSVSFDPILQTFDYQVEKGGQISLSNSSFIDLQGILGGTSNLTAEEIFLSNGSAVYTSSLIDNLQSNDIGIETNSLIIDGTLPSSPSIRQALVPPGVLVDNYGPGISGDIKIRANNILLLNGGILYQRSFASGAPGNILVESNDSIVVEGQSPISPGLASAISTANIGPTSSEGMDTGNILINTRSLNLSAGGFIATSTVGQGDSGNIDVEADDITISATANPVIIPSAIISSTVLNVPAAILLTDPDLLLGDAGEIRINTNRLRILEGGQVVSSSTSSGNAGSIEIRASEAVQIDGVRPDGVSSRVSSEAFIFSPSIADFFGLESTPAGESGAVSIFTPELLLSNAGIVSVENQGTGNAGSILIESEVVDAFSQASIIATTNGGEGGNVTIDSESVFFSGGSSINASASEIGGGGNIVIDSDAIALLNESTIAANAEAGSGGQVQLQSNTLFQSPSSAITATSEGGPALDGGVEITVQEESSRTEEQLSQTLELPSTAVACTRASEEGFAFVGRGGLPRSSETLRRSWEGWNPPTETAALSEANQDGQIIEAQGFLPNGDGTVRFVDQATLFNTITASGVACVANPPA